MTQEEFIKVLKEKRYPYKIEGDKIIVTRKGDVSLNALTSLPPGVVFRNDGSVWLRSLTSLPSGVEFSNGGHLNLDSLTSLPPGVEFKNGGVVDLRSITSLPSGMEFKNREYVSLESLIGGWLDDWEGNIEGIESKRLLNKMIKQGVFER